MIDYDNKYSNAKCYWGKTPHSLVVELAKLLSTGAKILDLGAGEGKDAIYLAKQGFKITAIDSSEVGIKKIKQLAQQLNLNIETEVDDMDSYLDKCRTYDAIICINVLHFLKKSDDINNIIKNIQAKTNSEGFNAIASFVTSDNEKKLVADGRFGFTFDEGEMKKYYNQWDILEYSEKWSELETHGEAPHRHYTVHLLTKKRN